MIAFFAKHPTAANLLMVIMLAAGLLSVSRLRRETFPDALPTVVEIRVVFPGATATEVEETIVHRLEDELDSVQYLKEMNSVAAQSLATITLEMRDGGDYTAFRNEIDNAISGIDDFPELAEPPVVTRLNTREPVLDILVSGPMTHNGLKAYCEDLRRRLLASPTISEVKLDGFSDRVLRVELSREAMLRFGLSPTEVADAISRQSQDLPAGKIEGEENIIVRVEEARKTRMALEDLVIKADPGAAEIRLRDIARVLDEFELDEEKITVNGERGALLKVLKAKSEDTVRVAQATRQILEHERAEQPQVNLEVINDRSALVIDRISLLLKNGWQGCLLVFATMWLFFNARLSFWVVFSLPVSFLAAFSLVPGFGLTINMLTMVGLLMALGLLMDDGIVIAENIARRRSQGESPMAAAVHGVKEVAGGVFSSFLTTCSVLGPLIFLNGEIGKILKVLPMMLLLVLATSLIEAFLILPSHLGHSLSGNQSSSRFRQSCERWIEAARAGVVRLVTWTIRWRYLTAGLVLMSFLLSTSLMAGGFVRFQVFPELEGDTIVARLLLPAGTPLEASEKIVALLERNLEETNAHFRSRQPDNQDLVQTTFVRYNQNLDANEIGPHAATLQADLLSNEDRVGSIAEIVSVWREKFVQSEEYRMLPSEMVVTFDEPAIGPAGRDIELQLLGRSLEELKEVSDEIQGYLATYEGVNNLTDDLRLGESEILISLRPGAVGLGITALEMARQLRGSFQGLLTDQIQVGEEAYDIQVRFAKDDRDSTEAVEFFQVTLPQGKTVPLGEIAELSYRRSWSRIAHTDGRRVVTVFGDVDNNVSNALAVIGAVEKEVLPELQDRYPGLEMRVKGASENGRETGQSMRTAAVIGCLGVFVILSFQFRSYVEPLIVMAAIPFAFVGVVWGHFLWGISLSMPSMMGYASLAGIVVNDSILLVLFLKSRRAEGVPLNEAAIASSRLRFRAVMITSLTTIAGLLPLLSEQSLQAQVLIPIALSICFGLMASTILVLLVIPPLYVLLADFGLTTDVNR